MRLTCPNCATQYDVDVTLFPQEGREVQCSTCEEVWVQYPTVAEPPMKLDMPAAMPSDRLSDDERDSLRSAVAEEMAAQDDSLTDKDIVRALRQQISAEGGGNFEKEKKASGASQKRNLRAAAEAAGIDVDTPDDTASRRRWGQMDDLSGPAPQAQSRSGLSAALKDYEAEARPRRRRRGGRLGTVLAILIGGIAAGGYIAKPQIVEAYPPAEPYLDQLADYVDQGRVVAEGLYIEYMPVVMDLVGEGRAMVEDLMAGDEGEA